MGKNEFSLIIGECYTEPRPSDKTLPDVLT